MAKGKKKEKDPRRVVDGAWNAAVHETDWSPGSQVSVLRGFLHEEAENNLAMAERFKDYLYGLVADEMADRMERGVKDEGQKEA